MKTRYTNLDVLRLLLALEVVAGHCWIKGMPEWINPVPAFVCLSGMLIPASFAGSRGWSHFAWKRLLRVGPAFVVALLLVAALFGLSALVPTLLCYVTLGIAQVGFNGVLWSLAVEEILYTSHAIQQIKKWWSAEIVAVLLGVCLLACCLHLQNIEERLIRAAAAYFLGNLFYFNLPKIERIHWSVYALGSIWAIGWSGVALGATVVRPYGTPQFAAVHATSTPLHLPIMLLSVAFVVLCARQMPQLPIKKEWPDFSYGLYIYHKPILIYLATLGLIGWPLLYWGLPITFGLAVISFFSIEKPALKYKNRLPHLPKRTREPKVVEVAA